MASCTAFSEPLTSAGILGNAGARVTATAESAESECLEISAAVSGSAGAAGAGAAGSGSAGTGTGGTGGSVVSWRPGATQREMHHGYFTNTKYGRRKAKIRKIEFGFKSTQSKWSMS